MQSNGLNSQPAENESMILEEEIDETYEPTKEEILEYAEYIGINLEEDKDLLYLAKEGLKAPLPPDWKPCQNREGKIYYFNFKTKQSQWEHPCDQYYKNLYQELKRKKEKNNEKQPTFRVKNNPSHQSKQTLNKKEPLPALKSNAITAQNAFQGLETSFNAENHNVFSLNNEDQESQSTENKEIKTILTDFESFKAPEKDQPPVDDFTSYEKEKLQEIEKLQKLHQEALDEVEKRLQREMDRHLKESKKTLTAESNSNNFLKEKEQIKTNLAKEYKAQFEEKLHILKDIHRENKAQFEIKEGDKIKQDLRLEEEDLDEEYEMKIISLKEEKKNLENKLQESQKRQNEARLKIEQDFENEKSALTKDYSRLIREARAKESLAQKTEIQNYQNLMSDRLENEKKILIDVRKQKGSIRNARVTELTKIYERQLKLEEERMENNLIKNLKEFEEHEKIKRDKDILRIFNDETNHAKTTQELFVQNEIENLRNDLKSRFENFQQLLKEKFKKEKQDLDDQIEERIGQYKAQVQDIKIDLINTREEILIQLRKGCAKEDNPVSQIEEINSRIQAQKEENNKLKGTLHALQSEQRAVQSNLTKIVQDLTQKIKKVDLEINNSKPQKAVRPKSANINRREHSKSSINLDALKKDVEEIKALVTSRDRSRPTLVSGRETVRETRGSHRHSLMIGKLPLWIHPNHPQEDLPLTQKTRNWNHILNVEQDKLRTLKKDFKSSRAALKKAHECLSYDREKFHLQYSHKHSNSISQPFLKNELKTNLNSNIEKLNQGVSHLKQTGELIKNKEKILNQLKIAVNQFENYEISLSELEAVYQEYQDIQIVEQTVTPKENLATTARHHKSKSVLHDDFDFEQSICNTSRAIEESQILKPHHLQNFEHLIPKQYSQRNTAQEADIQDQGNYSYRNLISILEMKVKSDTLIPTSMPVQRQITRSTNSRAKLQNMFRDHSRFLTDIKDQLNKTLYERPSKNISFIK